MKTYFFLFIFIVLTLGQSVAQESSVKILLDENERFRFEDNRLHFTNPENNVLIGDSAGANTPGNPFANNNVFIGYRAGFFTDAGNDNVFIGDSCGMNNTSGELGTMIGAWSGYANSTGTRNAFYGIMSGAFNTTGHRNTFIGPFSGVANDTGFYNTYLGHATGYYSTGSCNTFLGKSAGVNNKGDSSVMIGFMAGQNDTASHKLYISNSETNDPLIYGEFDKGLIRFNAQRIDLRSNNENTFIGDSAGAHNTTGSRNVFLGFKAGYNNTEGNLNVFIGDSTGASSTTGSRNVMMGTWAGWSNTTGSGNVMLGFGAGADNSIGNSNIFIGSSAGGVNTEGYLNVVVGATSGYSNTTGTENVFLGASAGAFNATGSANTYLGRRAGFHNETGDSNVFIGNRAGFNELSSHRLYISNSDTATPLIYGEFDNELLRVHGTLDVKGVYHFPVTDGSSGEFMQTDGSGNLGWASAHGDFSNGGENGFAFRTLGNQDAYGLGFITTNTTRMTITSNGEVGIGESNPETRLHIKAGSADDGITIERASAGLDSRIQFQNEGGVNQSAIIYDGSTDEVSFTVQGMDDVLHLKNNGSVGMQNANPLGDMHINGHLIIDRTSTSSDYMIGDNIYYNNGWKYIANGYGIITTYSAGGDFAVNSFSSGLAGNAASITTRFYVKNSGNIGIGTTVPDKILHIKSGGSNDGIVIERNSAGLDTRIQFQNQDGVDQSAIIYDGSSDDLSFTVQGNNDVLRLRYDGNVGIGTGTPLAKLDVDGTTGYSQLRLRTSFTPDDTDDPNGNVGDIAWDDNYFYVKTSAGWKRAALTTW